jgi:hypothetical protein
VSVNLTPIISGQVIIGLSWRWTFWLLAITFGVVLACTIVFLPETTFNRSTQGIILADSTLSTRTTSLTKGEKADDKNQSSPQIMHRDSEIDGKVNDFAHGRFRIHDQKRGLGLLVAPLVTLMHPVVLWSSAMWSVVFTWVIIQGAVAAQIFQGPPYNMTAIGVGNLVGIAPMIGSILGTVIAGRLSDSVVKIMAARNKGVYEPEYRLIIMIPFLITMVIGGFGLGLAIHHGLSAVICGVFLAFLNFAVGVGCTSIVTYSNDACQKKPGEVFGIAMVSFGRELSNLPLVTY